MSLDLPIAGAPKEVLERAKQVMVAAKELEAAYEAYATAVRALGGSPPQELLVSLRTPTSPQTNPS